MWGAWWRRRELDGYARRSSVEAVAEICRVGITTRSDRHLFNSSSMIHVPVDIEQITQRVNELPQQQRIAIVGKYVKSMSTPQLTSWGEFGSDRLTRLLVLKGERGVV